MAPAGAGTCDYGDAVPQAECQAAVQSLLPAETTMGRTLQTGSDASCGSGGWDAVPSGCSAQSGGDWAPHFQTASKTCAGSNDYQLVCESATQSPTNAPTITVPTSAAPTSTSTAATQLVLSRCSIAAQPRAAGIF